MRAVVVADGVPDASDERIVAAADLVIAADGGAGWLDETGHAPDALVGDLDSVEPALVDRLAAGGTAVLRHPREKDASDTELAIDEALRRGATEVVLLGALGGERLDHELANLLLLADRELPSGSIRIVRGATSVRAVRGPDTLALTAGVGGTVTLLPIGGDAGGVTTRGLRYPLDGEALRMGRSRGLSNVVVAKAASVRVAAGTLLVIEITEPMEENDDGQ
jgi:thiamine pyrophosphokinase